MRSSDLHWTIIQDGGLLFTDAVPLGALLKYNFNQCAAVAAVTATVDDSTDEHNVLTWDSKRINVRVLIKLPFCVLLTIASSNGSVLVVIEHL